MSRNIENKPGHNKMDFQTINDQNPVPYAATSALTLFPMSENRIKYAQLTGAMTINADVSGLVEFDKVWLFFETDATQRIVTLGTGFESSGTVTIPANQYALVFGMFNGTSVIIGSREISA